MDLWSHDCFKTLPSRRAVRQRQLSYLFLLTEVAARHGTATHPV